MKKGRRSGHQPAVSSMTRPDVTKGVAILWTQGQPWLVNAIAREMVEKILEQDASRAIEPPMITGTEHGINRTSDDDEYVRDLRAEGLKQLVRYLDTLGAAEGWLVLFDQRPQRSGRNGSLGPTSRHVVGRIIHVVGA